MIIDSHQHYWKIDRGDYGWMSPENEVLNRDYLPAHLTPLLKSCDVQGTVVVQAAPTEAETRFLLDIAQISTSVLGVVGWVDLTASNVEDRLDGLINYGGGALKGIRPMIQDIEDPDWILDSSLNHAFELIAARGLVFDALVQPIHLSQLERRLKQHPELKCVIDHGAKPHIAEQARSAWSEAMYSIARNTSAYCKLSGLVTEAGEHWKEEDIRPYIGDLIYHFGAGRLIWGSDWPVLNTASDYPSWFNIARNCCQRLSPVEQAKIFGQNAIEIYGLEALCPQ